MRLCLALVLCLASGPVAAQFTLDWATRGDANAALPPSIRVFESTTSGVPAWYVRASPEDVRWRLSAELSDAPGGTETLASFASGAAALVAVNGGYFGGGQSFSLVRDEGQSVASNIAALTRSGQTYYPTRGAFGINDAHEPDVAWVYDVSGVQTAYDVPNANREGQAPEPRPTATFPAGARPWDVSTAIGGGPVLVEDGQVVLTWEEEVFFGGSGVDTTSTRARTAVGYDANGHLLLLAAGETRGLTLRELAEVMVDIGAVEAVNLDGGGSTGMIAGGVSFRPATRSIASALMLVPDSDVDTIILDTEDAAYSEEGIWFESANTPFYGTSPARLLEVGTDGQAVYSFDGIEPGTYQIEAWWVPGSNRAADTPYTIYYGDAMVTQRVDQTDPATAGRWNPIAQLPLAPGDSLVITGDATPAGEPRFVCVDAIRLRPPTPTATEPTPDRPLALRAAP
ncbi:MAG: phosphodiester glycosidase family protein, partial [Bacteroidota bacterium]